MFFSSLRYGIISQNVSVHDGVVRVGKGVLSVCRVSPNGVEHPDGVIGKNGVKDIREGLHLATCYYLTSISIQRYMLVRAVNDGTDVLAWLTA